MTLHKFAPPASAIWLILGMVGIGGCATQPETQSGFLGDYTTLSAASADAGLGEGRVKAQRPDRQVLARYDRIVVDPVVVQASDLDADQIATLRKTLSQAIATEIGKQWMLTDRPGAATLRLRVAITDVTQASVPLNVATTVLIGAFSNGGAAGEVEVLDSQSGRRVAALTWSDQRRFSDLLGFYSATGHARSLMPTFAATIAQLIARS